MSGGYGGRLLGAIKTHINYIATEPAKETFDGLNQIAKDWGNQSNLFGIEQRLEIIQSGSEDYVPKEILNDFNKIGFYISFNEIFPKKDFSKLKFIIRLNI